MSSVDGMVTRRSWPVQPLVVAAVAVVIFLPGILFSWTAAYNDNGNGEFHFCYVPGSGTVYRIDGPGLRDACASPSHVPFTVSTGLAAGAITAPFLGPIHDRVAEGQVQAGRINRVTASCEEGERLLSGGGNVSGIITSTDAPDIAIIRMGRSTDPSAPPESWDVSAVNRTTNDHSLRAVAFCLGT